MLLISKKEENDSKTLNLLSTHPLTDDRIKFVKDVALRQKGIHNNEKLDCKWNKIVGQLQ